ncbi:FAD-dependent oxidoreductase [Pannonibacter indicus]|uniref:Glycine oxidase n=1 Tax=Pannonibacter indicus TaxID=466044 RepID=A0A0K6HR21_9HYPH|nr:FAD-dependent oxidoreductase [Pannonibacter indicus]CUA93218.1 glycine oxidase [Pannonibacter indicus]
MRQTHSRLSRLSGSSTVLVRGAGVAGLAAALELSRLGLAVTVADTGPAPGHGASFYAGGMLAPWCEAETAGPEVLKLGLEAADWWDAAVPGLVSRKGTLVLCPPRDQAELRRFASRSAGHRMVDAAEIAELEPALAGRFLTGLFFESEAHLDPRLAMAALWKQLEAQGVTFRLGDAAQRAESEASLVIDCTGPGAIDRVQGLRGVRGEMLYLETSEISLSRPVRLLHPRHPLYVVPRGGGRFMVGATMIESDDGGPVTARSVMELTNTAYALHPAFGEARIVELGAGVRPAFDDNMPRVVAEREHLPPGTDLAVAGMYRHGFLLAPALARQAADMAARRLMENTGDANT